jgi:CTP:molybdopterin cytidylyltransferase MocA
MALAGLLLAAGESTRMGTIKALLEWEGTTLLEYQVSQLRAARLGEVVVVLGHEAELLRSLLERPNPLAPFPARSCQRIRARIPRIRAT